MERALTAAGVLTTALKTESRAAAPEDDAGRVAGDGPGRSGGIRFAAGDGVHATRGDTGSCEPNWWQLLIGGDAGGATEDEAPGGGADLPTQSDRGSRSEAAAGLKIPCIVAGVGYTFVAEVPDGAEAQHLRNVAWTAMLKKIGDSTEAAQEVGDNDLSPITANDTRCFVVRCLDWCLVQCLSRCLGWCLLVCLAVPQTCQTWCDRWCPDRCIWRCRPLSRVLQAAAEWIVGFWNGDEVPECALYWARGPKWLCMSQWLSLDDSLGKALKRGVIPWRIKWYFMTYKTIGPRAILSERAFPADMVPESYYIIVRNVPAHVKKALRVATRNERRYYKLVHAQGQARLFALLSWICAVLTLGFGTYLYGINANLVRGSTSDFDNRHLWTVGIERAAFYAFPLLGGVMLKQKITYSQKCDSLKVKIDYSPAALV